MAKKEPWKEIRTNVKTLYADHLAHALDNLRESLECKDSHPSSADALRSQRCALSAIMHGSSSLESALNYMAYRMFTLDDAPEFVPVEERGFFAKSMIRRWTNLRVPEKCDAVLCMSNAPLLGNDLSCRLLEVNTLRNWIVHGTCYHSTLLVAPSAKVQVLYEVVDEERGDSWKDWEKKFPQCKFSHPVAINSIDAQTALRVLLQALLVLSKGTGFRWFYTTCKPHLRACGLVGTLECNLDAMLGIEPTEET